MIVFTIGLFLTKKCPFEHYAPCQVFAALLNPRDGSADTQSLWSSLQTSAGAAAAFALCPRGPLRLGTLCWLLMFTFWLRQEHLHVSNVKQPRKHASCKMFVSLYWRFRIFISASVCKYEFLAWESPLGSAARITSTPDTTCASLRVERERLLLWWGWTGQNVLTQLKKTRRPSSFSSIAAKWMFSEVKRQVTSRIENNYFVKPRLGIFV